MTLTIDSSVTIGSGSGSGAALVSYASNLISCLPVNASILPAGDSLTAGLNTKNNGVWTFDAGTDYIGTSIFAAKVLNYISNAGVAGNTAADLLARLQTDVVALAPNICPVLIGTNNLISGMANSAYTSLMNTVEAIIIQLLGNNILPILVTPPPKNAAATEAKRVQWYYYRLAKHYNLPLIDIYKILVDPSNGNYQAAYTSDGTHLSISGIAAIQPTVTTIISNLRSPLLYPYFGSVAEAVMGEFSNLVRNGNFNSQSAPPDPDGWTLNKTNASYASASASSPYNGKQISYTLSVAAGQYALQGTPITSGFSVGDTMYVAFRVNTSGLTPASASGYQILAALTGGGANSKFVSKLNTDNIFSTEFVIPASTTQIVPQLYVQDTGVYAFNNFTIVNKTAHDAIWRPGQQ